ncbi:hypothetical protein AAC387_Pa09g0558 [Persea americana]
MATEDAFPTQEHHPNPHKRSGYCPKTGIYRSLLHLSDGIDIPKSPNLDLAKFIFSHFPHPDRALTQIALIDSATDQQLTYAQLHRSVRSLAAGLHHGLGVGKGDVVLLLSHNSLLYPVICLAVLSVGAVLTTANPLNTEGEIVKQVRDSGAKLAISAPEEVHKLKSTGVPTIVTTEKGKDDPDAISIEELLDKCEPLDIPSMGSTQSDTAALLYSSGTTGFSKGVVLTHANLISIIALLRWTVQITGSTNDVYLAFLPMFHVYGLAFFALGLFTVGTTTVLMPRFNLRAMLDAVHRHQVTNIPAVPPVILAMVKISQAGGPQLSSLRRVGCGAAPLSGDLANEFRAQFPWVELRPGYGLTESCGATTFFVSDRDARERPRSVGSLFPGFCAKVVDVDTGAPLQPNRKGELLIKSPSVMKGYLKNDEATSAAIDGDGWLHTGDLCYFDDDGFIYIVDRIKELVKHNGYQVAPAELEAVLLTHPHILDAAVIPAEDEESGQIPVAYVVKASNSGMTEDQVIQFVASRVASFKRVKKVRFAETIPKSAAGKILRKQLVAQYHHTPSKL